MYDIDLHTHSIFSGHAYSTIDEMVRFAKKKKMSVLGISDHGTAMPGSCHEYYFHNLHILKDKYKGIKVLCGVEANIVDFEGNLDMSDSVLDRLDYAIASVHWNCLKPGKSEENTNAYLGAMKHKKVKIIGHPDDGEYEADYDLLISQAKKNRVLIELNNASLNPGTFRKNSEANIIKIMELCEKYKADVILSSDAHTYHDIGDFSRIKKLIQKYRFPEELIVNCNPEKYTSYFENEK